MAVVAFDSKRLRILTDWTAPGPALEETLRAAAKRRGHLEAGDFDIASDLKPWTLTDETLSMDNSMQAADYEANVLKNTSRGAAQR
jgi:hypothetical protein